MSTPPISPPHTPQAQAPHTPPQNPSNHTIQVVAQQVLQTPPTTTHRIPPSNPRLAQLQHSGSEDSTSNSLFDFLNSPPFRASPQQSAPNTDERANRLEQNTAAIRHIQDRVPIPIFVGNWRADLNALTSQPQPLFGEERTSRSRRERRDPQEAILVSQRIRQLENRQYRNETLLAARRNWDRPETNLTRTNSVQIHAPTEAQLTALELLLPLTLHTRYNERTQVITMGEDLYANFQRLYPTIFPNIWPRN